MCVYSRSIPTTDEKQEEINELKEQIRIVEQMISKKQEQLAQLKNKLIRLKYGSGDHEQISFDDLVGE